MKNLTCLLLFVFLAISCGDEVEITPVSVAPDEFIVERINHDLVGDWTYEREVISNFPSVELDKNGSILFDSDKSGHWTKSPSLDGDFNFSWEVEDTQKYIYISVNNEPIRRFDMLRVDQDNFTFTRTIKIPGLNPAYDKDEILTLTRKL